MRAILCAYFIGQDSLPFSVLIKPQITLKPHSDGGVELRYQLEKNFLSINNS